MQPAHFSFRSPFDLRSYGSKPPELPPARSFRPSHELNDFVFLSLNPSSSRALLKSACLRFSSPTWCDHSLKSPYSALDIALSPYPVSQRSSIQLLTVFWDLMYSSVASRTTGGGSSPILCHSTHPSIAHFKIPGYSAWSFAPRSRSRSSGGMVARNGIRLNRRRIASSVDLSLGLLFPAMMILNCGTYSKKSPRMNRADTSSPPVIVLILF